MGGDLPAIHSTIAGLPDKPTTTAQTKNLRESHSSCLHENTAKYFHETFEMEQDGGAIHTLHHVVLAFVTHPIQ